MGDELITEEINSASGPVTLAGIYAPDSRQSYTLTSDELTQDPEITLTISGG
jgi:hypothetical protein